MHGSDIGLRRVWRVRDARSAYRGMVASISPVSRYRTRAVVKCGRQGRVDPSDEDPRVGPDATTLLPECGRWGLKETVKNSSRLWYGCC
jgi:hypothetical protein